MECGTSNGFQRFHFTVNADGQVRLWDSPRAAVGHRIEGEVQVDITLTATQYRSMVRAHQLAVEKKLDYDRR